MPDSSVLEHVLGQIKQAKPELVKYAPGAIDWYGRALDAASALVPWLESVSPDLCTHAAEVLNSTASLRNVWDSITLDPSQDLEHAQIDKLFELQSKLLKRITGETVSSIVTDFLVERYSGRGLAGNSRSDYPDLYLLEQDYSALPKRTGKSKEFGAATRGSKARPVRVPDGLEIKTARNKASIDCHFPHVGLHLMVLYQDSGSRFEVNDAKVAFMRKADYKVTKPKSKSTTLKASFGHAKFKSLLS